MNRIFFEIYRYREVKKKGGKNDEEETNDRRVIKGGSFMDNRDGGDYRSDRLKIRISARLGRDRAYSAYNLGFRCVQSIQPNERGVDFRKSSFKVFKLRAPKVHGLHDDL